MTTATRTELMTIAKEAAAYITRLGGESDTFRIDGDTLSAVIAYEADTGEDRGDYWTAPSWWIEREQVYVKGVYNEDGETETEAAEWLAKQLNKPITGTTLTKLSYLPRTVPQPRRSPRRQSGRRGKGAKNDGYGKFEPDGHFVNGQESRGPHHFPLRRNKLRVRNNA